MSNNTSLIRVVLLVAAATFGISSAVANPFGIDVDKQTDNLLEKYRNSQQRAMCDLQSYEEKLDRVILDDVPSILEQCGIGGMFDFCSALGNWAGAFSKILGCNGNGGGGGSNFCDWGWNKDSAKKAWKIYRGASLSPEIKIDENEQTKLYAVSDDNPVVTDEAKLKALGLI